MRFNNNEGQIMGMSKFHKLLGCGVLAVAAISTTACSPMHNVKGGSVPAYAVPFSISFDREGNPVVFDEKGEAIKPAQVDLPIKASEIRSINSITAIAVKGSCFYVLNAGGRTYNIPLPPEYCK